MTQIDLSGLRDIHLRTEPAWWPPAIGWWIMCVIIITAIGIGVGLFWLWRNSPKQYALRELAKLYHTTDNPVLLARGMSALFRRIALTRYPRKRVAALSDEDWMRFLITRTKHSFSDEQAKLLAFSTYLPDNMVTPDAAPALYAAGRQGIIEFFKRKKHGN